MQPAHPPLRARYYDGRSAIAHTVTLKVASYGVDIVAENRKLLARWPRRGLTLGGSFIEDGSLSLISEKAPDARVIVADRTAARALAQLLPDAVGRKRQENRSTVLRYGAITLALVGLGVVLVDHLPELVAPLIPFETKRAVGTEVAETLFPNARQCIAPGGVEPLSALAERLRLAAGIDDPLQVRIVDDEMVNAFAAPGGMVVLTSGLIDNAKDADQVAGVLAHEIGHVQHDHATIGVLRSMGISAMLQLMTAGSGVETLASAGGTLAWLSYSRAAEEEADAAGVAMLEQVGMNADGLGRFFRQLEQEEDGLAGFIPSWLSTHPSTDARREATERPVAGSPALSDEEWRELQGVCAIRE